MIALTRDQLRTHAASVFSSAPWERMSPNYRVVPTVEVASLLEDRGFFSVRAQQGRTRIHGKEAFIRHLLQFRQEHHLHSSAVTKVPEVILPNSFEGTSAFKFHVGICRAVCLNRLVVASADLGGVSVRHSGLKDLAERVIEATYRIMDETPKAMQTMEE